MADIEGIRSIAARQHGLVSRRQIRELGVLRAPLQRLVRAGHLTYVTPRVLKIGGSAESRWQSVMAGVLDVGPNALASHLTAAAMWGVPNIAPEPVHVSVVRYVRRTQAPVKVHHLTVIPDEQQTYLYDIPVTAPAFTVLLVCGAYGKRRGAQVLDHLLASRDVTVAEAFALTQDLAKQGRNGLVILRELLETRQDDSPPAQSNNERRLEYLAGLAGITSLRRQVNIYAPNWIGRVDFDDVELPFIVEVHSERYHTSWEHRRADAKRIARLEQAGNTVVVVWDYELWYEPDQVIDRLLSRRLECMMRAQGGSPPRSDANAASFR